MPIHPDVAARFHYLDGITHIGDAYRDQALIRQIQQFESWDPEVWPPKLTVRESTAPGPHGSVPVRIYSPPEEGTAARPCLVWLHGGGFAGGDLDMREADWTAREVSDRAGAVVVSVDYRLAVGGVHYPIPHNDAVAAVSWVRDCATDLHIDSERIAIGGASAGANLVAGAALKLRDTVGWIPAVLILVYGAFHPRQPLPSRHLAVALSELPPLFNAPPSTSNPTEENYLGGSITSADGYAFPANGVLDGLCPTLVLNAEYDYLRASAEEFAAAAVSAGVDVKQVLIRGMLHGFLNLPAECEPVAACLDNIAAAVIRGGI